MILDVSDKEHWNEVYLPLLDAEKEQYATNVLYGSGGSGKSRFIVQRIVTKCFEHKRRRYAIIRKVQSTLRHSVFQEFLDVIEGWGLEKYFDCTVSPLSIKGPNGNKIIFLGCDKREKLKSLAEMDEVFIEEITELDILDYLQIDIRLRGVEKESGKKILWAAFNPIDEGHWVKSGLIDIKDKSVRSLKTTYKDNRFVGGEYEEKMQRIRLLDENYYNIYALGIWGTIRPEFPFFYKFDEKKHVTAHFAKYGRWPMYDPTQAVYLSLDFNKNNSCIVSQKNDETGYYAYLEEYHRGVGFDLRDLAEEIIAKYGRSYIFVTGDPAGNSQNSYSKKNNSGYDLFKGYLTEFTDEFMIDFSHVSVSPMEYKASKRISNAVLLHEQMYFHPDMIETIADLKKMKQSKDGGLDKVDCDKHDYGHLGDCVRYDHAFHMIERWHGYGYAFKE